MQNFGKIYIFFNTNKALLITPECVLITSDYVITIWHSHLQVLISELIQSKSAPKTQCCRAKKISAEQRWFRADSFWNSAELRCFPCSLNQRWKTSKRQISEIALFTSETSTRFVLTLQHRSSRVQVSHHQWAINFFEKCCFLFPKDCFIAWKAENIPDFVGCFRYTPLKSHITLYLFDGNVSESLSQKYDLKNTHIFHC